MRKNLVYILLLCFILCGCQVISDDSTTPAVTTEQISSETPTEFVTDATTLPATEPDNRLGVPSGKYSERFEKENGSDYMDYWVYIPDNATIDMPIVVFLHGSWEIGRMDLLEDYGIVGVVKEIYGEDFPFILLLPNTHASTWTVDSVPETLKGLIESVAEKYEADSQRIIITGHSLGSIGTWYMTSLYGDFFSAAVPISCGIDEPMNFENCAKVPIMAFSGTVGNDEKNYNKAMHVLVSKINDAGGNATMNTMEGADHEDAVTKFYTRELFEWMITQ